MGSSGIFKPYGEIWAENESGNITLTDQTTWYQYNQFEANGNSRGVTPDYTNDHLTIATPGIYKCCANIMFEGTQDEEYEWEIQCNNGAVRHFQAHTGHKIVTTSTWQVASGITAFLSLNASDTVELWVRCTTAAGTFIRGRDVNMNVHLIG